MAENKKISTRLVLRNDDLSAWNASKVELLKGEAALARLTGDLSDFYEVRIGTGDKTWSQLGSSNIRIPAKNVEGLEQSITSLSTSFNYVGSVDALNALSATANNGDFAVVSSEIATGKVSYTAYRFNSAVKAWQALDGNYDASNVYFGDDLTYTAAIGVLTQPNGSAKIQAKGKSVADVLKSILAKQKNPVPTQPSVQLKFPNANAYEAGTNVSPSYEATFNAGSYTYGPATGITVTSWSISDGTTTLTTASGKFDDFRVKTDTRYKITATANHTEGVFAKDNLGSTTTIKIPAGSKSATSKEITGYNQGYFIGTLTDVVAAATLSSKRIRNLSKKPNSALSTGSISITVPVGAATIVIAAKGTRTLSKVLNTTVNADMTTSFVKAENIKVYGADANTSTGTGDDAYAATYTVWTFSPAEPYGSTANLTITLA